jgi:hypothetical protein
MQYEVTTALTERQVFERAVAHFGPGGEGLEITRSDGRCLVFEGGGGYVAITLQPQQETTIELETREWDRAVQQFMQHVH